MVERVVGVLEIALPVAAAILVLLLVGEIWVARAPFPYDLEWMEGGMLAHAWRIRHGLPLYVAPNPEFVPYVYPPGYASLVALLGVPFELTPLLGRAVSIAGTAAAAAAAAFVVGRAGGGGVASLVAAAAFVGTYPATGAFFDLVRPDALTMGLLAWSIAIGLERHPQAPIAAGLLLAAAFLTKHNAALYGVPMLVGIGARDGWRAARSFALAAAVPALLAVVYLEIRSEGRFLLYLLRVPASHPSYMARVWPGTPREFGSPLPVAVATLTGVALWLGIEGQRALPRPLTTFLPVTVGMVAGSLGTYIPPRDPGLYNVPSGVAFFAVGAIPVALGLFALGRWLERPLVARAPIVGWRGLYGLGVAVVALVSTALMRAHNGGYLNVNIPWLWVLCVGFGVILGWLGRRPTGATRAVVAATATAQLSWALAQIDREALVPTDADRALGDRLVAAARTVDGEVLSPFAAWIPVYAGHPPSLHYMGLWDLEYDNGPFVDQLDPIREAVRERRWAMVFAATQPFPYALSASYEELETVIGSKDRAGFPKTGWRVRPNRILVPPDPR